MAGPLMATTPGSIAVLTGEQLVELVRGAVQEALAAQREDTAPALLDRNGIARVLGVSQSTVDRLRREGMPFLLLGDSPRFIADECVAWLREHRSAPEERGA